MIEIYSYIPKLVDSNLVRENCSILSLKPNLERRKLFNKKHIYFLSEKQVCLKDVLLLKDDDLIALHTAILP